jgi:phage tail protein X
MTDQPDREYTTVEGDTLTSVALKHYGPGTKGEWSRIYNANSEVLKNNPWYLVPGTVLRIPSMPSPEAEMAKVRYQRDLEGHAASEGVPDDIRMAALLVEQEARRAMQLHGPMRSGHEGHSVILEELDELWGEIKRYPKHDPAKWRKEAIHLGAMALRFLVDMKLLYVSHPPEE